MGSTLGGHERRPLVYITASHVTTWGGGRWASAGGILVLHLPGKISATLNLPFMRRRPHDPEGIIQEGNTVTAVSPSAEMGEMTFPQFPLGKAQILERES